MLTQTEWPEQAPFKPDTESKTEKVGKKKACRDGEEYPRKKKQQVTAQNCQEFPPPTFAYHYYMFIFLSIFQEVILKYLL